jgi:exodeoxyribonuclease VII small subunit
MSATIETPQPEKLTFEQANDELRRIVARLDEDDVPVHEICELTARGKALVAVQRAYLTEQQTRIEQIEAGEDLPLFEIVAPERAAAADEPSAPAAAALDPTPRPAAPAVEAANGSVGARSGLPAPADDDIPF